MENRISIINGLEYLNRIVKIGADLRFKPFMSQSRERRNDLMAQTFFRDFRNSFEILGVTRIGNDFLRRVLITAKGKDKDGNPIEREFSEDIYVAKMSIVELIGRILIYDFKVADKEKLSADFIIEKFNRNIGKRNLTEFKSKIELEVNPFDLLLLEKISRFDFWMQELPHKLAYTPEDKNLLKGFINVLRHHGLFNGSGEEVVDLCQISETAERVFPEYRRLSDYQKARILDKAYSKSYILPRVIRDKNILAKCVWEVLAEKKMHTCIFVNARRYDYISESRTGLNELKFINYQYKTKTGVTIRTSFLPFDLWHMLATNQTILNLDDVVSA